MVVSSRFFYLLAVASALVTLLPKFPFEQPMPNKQIEATLINGIDSGLEVSGYTPVPLGSSRIRGGVQGACNIVVGISGWDGGDDSYFKENFVGEENRLSYVYRRSWYVAKPALRAVVDKYRDRLASILWGSSPMHSVYLVSSSKECLVGDIESLRLDPPTAAWEQARSGPGEAK